MSDQWKTRVLGELCAIQIGKTPARRDPSYWDTEKASDNVWLSVADLRNTNGRHEVIDSKEYLSDEGAGISKAVKKGTLLVSFKLTLGRLAIAGRDLYTNEAIAALTIRDERTLNREFLLYFFQLFDWVTAAKDDVKLKGMTLNKSKLRKIPVLLPPLPEQERIVALLDRAFAGIDKAIANTEKNLASARELFESYLNSVFNQPDDRWTDKELDAFSKTVSTGPFGSVLHKSDYVSEGVPLVNPINIQGERIIPDAKKMISPKAAGRLRAYILNRGDIVIARRGEIGRCAVVTEEQDGWICGTGCFFIRPGAEVIPEFLAHLLRSAKYRERLERVATGATMPNLSNKALSTLHVSLPDVETQAAFVKDIAEFGAYCSNLQFTHEKQVTALAELKQSLLQKAFAGELTADRERDVEDALA